MTACAVLPRTKGDGDGDALLIGELAEVMAILCEELGYACAAVPYLSDVVAALFVSIVGSDEQRGRWLPALASGAAISSGSPGRFPDVPGRPYGSEACRPCRG